MPEERGFPASNAYGISSVPTLFLIERDGTVSKVLEGWRKKEIAALRRPGARQCAGMEGRLKFAQLASRSGRGKPVRIETRCPTKLTILGTAASLAKGMGVTFKEMMSPTVTEYYPDEPPKFEERFRGVHVLQRDVNGMEKCVACFLCSAACPANCIYIEAAENTEKVRISGGERYAAGLQHRLQPLHFLRILRRGLPHRRHHPRPRI